jgi:hypothetical protein
MVNTAAGKSIRRILVNAWVVVDTAAAAATLVAAVV